MENYRKRRPAGNGELSQTVTCRERRTAGNGDLPETLDFSCTSAVSTFVEVWKRRRCSVLEDVLDFFYFFLVIVYMLYKTETCLFVCYFFFLEKFLLTFL